MLNVEVDGHHGQNVFSTVSRSVPLQRTRTQWGQHDEEVLEEVCVCVWESLYIAANLEAILQLKKNKKKNPPTVQLISRVTTVPRDEGKTRVCQNLVNLKGPTSWRMRTTYVLQINTLPCQRTPKKSERPIYYWLHFTERAHCSRRKRLQPGGGAIISGGVKYYRDWWSLFRTLNVKLGQLNKLLSLLWKVLSPVGIYPLVLWIVWQCFSFFRHKV